MDRAKLEALSTCAYVREKENVLFVGPPTASRRWRLSPRPSLRDFDPLNGPTLTGVAISGPRIEMRRKMTMRRHGVRVSSSIERASTRLYVTIGTDEGIGRFIDALQRAVA